VSLRGLILCLPGRPESICEEGANLSRHELSEVSNNLFIAIAGNIGSGKTTLTSLLTKHFGWVPHYESVEDNPYLADFYDDMDRWSFHLQVFFLTRRYEAHMSIINGSESCIQDRTIYEDANIFARNLFENGQLTDRDYQTYLRAYHRFVEKLPAPDLMIYLRKEVDTLKDRISMRGRSYETNIPDKYLIDLNRYYDEWIAQYDFGKVLVIESDHLDFLNNSNHFSYLCDRILESVDQKDMFNYKGGSAEDPVFPDSSRSRNHLKIVKGSSEQNFPTLNP
jgi:deoxyadenosine/deoxycytidine kinase